MAAGIPLDIGIALSPLPRSGCQPHQHQQRHWLVASQQPPTYALAAPLKKIIGCNNSNPGQTLVFPAASGCTALRRSAWANDGAMRAVSSAPLASYPDDKQRMKCWLASSGDVSGEAESLDDELHRNISAVDPMKRKISDVCCRQRDLEMICCSVIEGAGENSKFPMPRGDGKWKGLIIAKSNSKEKGVLEISR